MIKGFGGSEDSGPASSPDETSVFSTICYVIFFGILPILILAFCLFYLSRGKLKMVKGQGEEGFFKVERRRTSRPPSRLNLDTKDISGPVSLETGHSAASVSMTVIWTGLWSNN
jgi:hypothetical protein